MKKRISFLLSLLLLLVLVVPTQASTAANPLGVHAYIVQEDGTRIPIQSLTIRQTVPTDFSQARLCALNDETYYEVIAAADVVRDASGTDRLQESNYFNDADFTFYTILNVAYKDAPTQLQMAQTMNPAPFPHNMKSLAMFLLLLRAVPILSTRIPPTTSGQELTPLLFARGCLRPLTVLKQRPLT